MNDPWVNCPHSACVTGVHHTPLAFSHLVTPLYLGMVFLSPLLIYLKYMLLICRDRGKEREREMWRETSVGCLLYTPYLGSILPPEHVP